MDENLNDLTVDALKEVSNIAAGHLSEVISQLTKTEMSISVPDAQIINVDNASINVGASDTKVLAGYAPILGDVMGSLVFLLSLEDAIKLAEHTLGEKVNTFLFPSPMEEEALSELIAITGGAYLTAITHLFNLFLMPKFPSVELIEAHKLVNFIIDQDESDEEYENSDIIGVSISYKVEESKIEGSILMLVGPNIQKSIKEKIQEK